MLEEFIKNLLNNEGIFEHEDSLQVANVELLALLREARQGLLSEHEYDLRMLEIKTKISILERQERLLEVKTAVNKNLVESDYDGSRYAHVEKQKLPRNLKANQPSYVYGDDWIVIQNRLLHAISRLSINERRLILFLSPLVRLEVSKRPKQRAFFVSALSYGEAFNISPKTVYRTLAKTAKDIQHKPFFYWQWRENHYNERGVAWFSECEYMKDKGGIEVVIGESVLEMLTIFDKHNQFTKYQKEYISHLGAYGVVLFELIASCMHQDYKKKTYTIKYLREKFDCLSVYERISDFKKNVLDGAIKDIEKHTPYRIKYVQKKIGREITEITFTFKDISIQDKPQNVAISKLATAITQKPSAKTNHQNWQNKGLTEGQIKKLAIYKNKFVEANQHLLRDKNTEYYQAFEDFKSQLQDPEQIGKFHQVAEFLALKKGDEPPKVIQKQVQSSKISNKESTKNSEDKGLTPEQIDYLSHHQQFQIDHPVKGYKVGSELHISYLKFRMDAGLSEFLGTNFNKYL